MKKSGVVDEDGSVVKFKRDLLTRQLSHYDVHYCGAIRNSGSSVDEMVQAIDTSFLHSVSTDQHPLHMKCPEHDSPPK